MEEITKLIKESAFDDKDSDYTIGLSNLSDTTDIFNVKPMYLNSSQLKNDQQKSIDITKTDVELHEFWDDI